MWVTKLLISPVKKGFFAQKRPNLARNCWLIWCPVGGLAGGCGAGCISQDTYLLSFHEGSTVKKMHIAYTYSFYTSHPCPANLLGSRSSPCLPPILAFSWSMSVLRSLTMASRKSKEPSSPFCPRLPGSPLQPLGPVSPGAPGGPTAPRLQAQ